MSPSVAVRSTLSVVVLSLALASCTDAPTTAPTAPTAPAAVARSVALDTTRWLPEPLASTIFRPTSPEEGSCYGYDGQVDLQEWPGPARCAELLALNPALSFMNGNYIWKDFTDGDSLYLACNAVRPDGRVANVPMRRRWTPSDSSRVLVEPDWSTGGQRALLRMAGPGEHVVNCEIDNEPYGLAPVYGTLHVTVRKAISLPRRIVLAPDTVRMEVGQPGVRLTRYVIDQYGDTNVTYWGDPRPTYTSSAPDVGGVSWDERVYASAPGVTTIVGTIDTTGGPVRSNPVTLVVDTSLTARIRVNAGTSLVLFANDVAYLGALAESRFGETLWQKRITYASANPGVATVSATGEVRAVGLGTTTLTLRSDTAVATVAVTVATPRVTRVVVTPATATVRIDEVRYLTAQALDQKGNAMSNVWWRWTSSNSTVAYAYGVGAVGGLRAGTATITATADGVSGSMQVTVVSSTPTPPPSTSPTPPCGDAAGCIPVTQAYFSHFTGPDCTGTEYYYTAYYNNDGIRRSWDGRGVSGRTTETVKVMSAKANDGAGDGTGCRRSVWGTAGYVFSGMARVYR